MSPPAGEPLGLQLSRTAKAISRSFDDALVAEGGSLPTWMVMISLRTQSLGSQRELAEAIGIRGATLTHHLNAMETDGLVTRRRDPANRRLHQVTLTERGEMLFRQLAVTARAHDQRLRHGLSEQEIATLEDLLHRMRLNVADDTADTADATDTARPVDPTDTSSGGSGGALFASGDVPRRRN